MDDKVLRLAARYDLKRGLTLALLGLCLVVFPIVGFAVTEIEEEISLILLGVGFALLFLGSRKIAHAWLDFRIPPESPPTNHSDKNPEPLLKEEEATATCLPTQPPKDKAQSSDRGSKWVRVLAWGFVGLMAAIAMLGLTVSMKAKGRQFISDLTGRPGRFPRATIPLDEWPVKSKPKAEFPGLDEFLAESAMIEALEGDEFLKTNPPP